MVELSTSYLAGCYYRCVGVEHNFSKAAALFIDLTEMIVLGKKYQGYLGLMVTRGIGMERNVREGLRIIRKGLKKNFGCGWA